MDVTTTGKKEGMFKKLKQKLEENADGRIENASFSQERLPGSIVRTCSNNHDDQLIPVRTGQELIIGASDGQLYSFEATDNHLGCNSNPSTDSENVTTEEKLQWQAHQIQRDGVPRHLIGQPNQSYQRLLEVRVQELEQECCSLCEKLNSHSVAHTAEVRTVEKQLVEVDRQSTDLKMQLIEAELEKVSFQQEHDVTVSELKEKLDQHYVLLCEERQHCGTTVQQLQFVIEERDNSIILLENECSELKKKVGHYESQLEAYVSSSESAVVSRLHSEVSDVEHRVQSRNLEIQILERHLAAQAKEKDEQVDQLLSQLEGMENVTKVMKDEARREKDTGKKLLMELETLKQKMSDMVKQHDTLSTQLTLQKEMRQKLLQELEDLQCDHSRRVQDMEVSLQDRDNQVRVLLQQVKHLQADKVVLEPLSRPPGSACRTVSVAVQTCTHHHMPEDASEAPIIPLQSPCFSVDVSGGSDVGPANMMSLSAADAMEVMKNHQSVLEDDLAEKMKIMKVQQQNIIDLKKELRLQQGMREELLCGKRHSPVPPLRVAIASDVNFQYLKHVVIRFMCSHPDEALQLTRAISTLLEFSPQEEEHVKNHLHYKMSWFGALPPPLYTPLQTTK